MVAIKIAPIAVRRCRCQFGCSCAAPNRSEFCKRLQEQFYGRGAVGKAVVAGVKDRDSNHVSAKVVRGVDALSLRGFVQDCTASDAKVYTDEARAYRGMPRDHETVNHSVGEYVREQAHTNGIESFWAMLKRGYHGTYHHISPKHLHRYVAEFAGRHNVRNCDTIDQMASVVIGMIGKRLMYRDLIAPSGLPSGACSRQG